MSSSIVIAVRALSGDGEEDDGGAAHGAHPQPNVAVPRSGDDPALLHAEPSGAPQVQVFRATRAWALGIQIFNTELTKDKRKKILVAAASSDVVATASTNALTNFDPRLTAVAAGNASRNQPEALSPLALLLKDTRDAAKRCDEKKSVVRKKLELIFSTLNRYANCVDVLIQQHPDTTAIAWGIIRMLVTVAASDQNTSERLSVALADIVDSIARSEDYQNIYPNAERLEAIIARLYAEVINFLVRSKKYYSTHGAMRIAKSTVAPFETKFGAILQRIDKLRQEVRDEVQLLSAQDQAVNVQESIKIHQDLISHIGKVKHNWLVEDQMRQETSTRKREKNLRTIRYWLDATHFDHLKREKHWQHGTCEWIMDRSDFVDWLDVGAGPFWIYGIPGCGKTVMSTFLQDRLAGMGRPIVQFWCKNDELSKRRPSFIVSTLLSQLLDHPELSAYQDQMAGLITKQYNKHKDITKVSIDSLCGLLESVLSTLPPVMIIIDALDECDPESLSRDFLIEKLTQFSNSVIGTKIILTSRQEEPFVESFEHCSSLEMSKDDVSNDIEAVIRKSIESAPKLQSLKERVTSALVAGADGMFLWAELMLATLKKARNRNAVEKMLANLPIGLREVYERILISIGQRLSEDELQLRREIFAWVTTAARPMTLGELSIALAIEAGTTSLDDGEIILRLENDVRDLCGPMLRISGDRTVQIVHMSVRDTLHSPVQISGSLPKMSPADLKYLVRLSLEMEHARLASACVTYLAFETFREKEVMDRMILSREELPLIATEHPMLEYATSYWIDHISASADAGAEFLNQILQFLQSDNVYVWIQLMTSFTGRSDHNFSVHILQRSKLLKWVENSGKPKDAASSQILNDYLLSAVESGVQLSQTLLGLNHVQTLKALQRLACLYDHEDRLEESRTIQQKLIDATSTSSAQEYREIFYKSCIELAYIYRVKSDYDRSIDLLERVLGGPDPSQWTYDATGAEAMADLGVVYRLKGDLEKAREMAEKGAEGLTVTLGPTCLMTVRYVIQLCRTYFACGMYPEAQTLLEETLKTADEVIGPEESATLHGRDLLGNILHAQGDLDAAETLLREVLRLMRAQWGENGRSTALLKTHVADVLVDKREFAEAIVMYQGAVETYEGLHGLDHPDTREAAVKLARCYGELELLDSAETVMVKYRLEVVDVQSVKRPGLSKMKEVTLATEPLNGGIVIEEVTPAIEVQKRGIVIEEKSLATETPKAGIVIEENPVTTPLTPVDDKIEPLAIEILKNDASLDVKGKMCDFDEGSGAVVSTTEVFDAMRVAIAY